MERKNTAVYVTGLPEDTTVQEVFDYFTRCGVIMDDLIIGGPRIKLYTTSEGGMKGDGLVVYLRPESVQLAVDLLDDSPLRPGVSIRVQPAEFHHHQQQQQEEESDTTTTSKPLRKEEWKKRMEMMNKRLDWGEDEVAQQRALVKQLQNECIVILKNMLPTNSDSTMELEVEQDAQEECFKFGPCKIITMNDRGLVSVKFNSRVAARACVEKMHGRYYCKRKLEATLHDGSFKIRKSKDVQSEEQRLDNFSKWIEEEPEDEEEFY